MKPEFEERYEPDFNPWFLSQVSLAFPNSLKKQVYEEQGGQCADCGEFFPMLYIHHIIPENALKGQGIEGKDVRENAVGLCMKNGCHQYWDDEAIHNKTIFPGKPLEEADPKQYKSTRKKKRR